MENFEKVKELINIKSNIDQHIKRLDKMEFIGKRGWKYYLAFTSDDYNEVYTFASLREIIGDDAIEKLKDKFKVLVSEELIKAKEVNEQELSTYSIKKESDGAL